MLQTLTSIPKTENQPTPFNLSTPQGLLSTLQELRQTVETEGKATFDQWRSHIERPEFLPSALNLAEYLALRRHDLRSLQIALKPWGLSSLGRIEARVMPNLDAVITTLEVICGSESHHNRPPIEFFWRAIAYFNSIQKNYLVNPNAESESWLRSIPMLRLIMRKCEDLSNLGRTVCELTAPTIPRKSGKV